jgi:hypothetical protein
MSLPLTSNSTHLHTSRPFHSHQAFNQTAVKNSGSPLTIQTLTRGGGGGGLEWLYSKATYWTRVTSLFQRTPLPLKLLTTSGGSRIPPITKKKLFFFHFLPIFSCSSCLRTRPFLGK